MHGVRRQPLRLPYEPAQHGRSCLGLLLAGAVATLVFGAGFSAVAAGSDDDWLDVTVIAFLFGAMLGALPATFILGFPSYFFLRGRGRIKVGQCLGAGAIIGFVTTAVWQMPAWPWFALGAASGAAGGLAFWWCAHKEIERDTVENS